MSATNKSGIVQTVKNVYSILSPKQRKQCLFMFMLLLVNSVLDVMGIGMIYPLIDASLNNQLISEKPYLNYFYTTFNFDDSVEFIIAIAIVVLIVLVVKNLASFFIYLIQTRFAFNVALDLNKRMFRHYYKRGFSFLKDENSGTQLYNVKQAPEVFAQNVLMQVLNYFTELFILSLILIGLIVYKPIVILLFLFVIAPIFLIFYFLVNKKLKSLGEEYQRLFPISSNSVLESMKAYVDVKLLNKEIKFLDYFLGSQKKIFDVVVLRNAIKIVPNNFRDIILVFGVIAILTAAWMFPENKGTIVPTLSLFALSAYRVIPSINKILSSMMDIKNRYPVFDILAPTKEADSHDAFQVVEKLPFEESIELKNISFDYNDGDKVLDDISLKILKGETVGIIGQSGSGKTTLVNLLLGLLPQNIGEIVVDGTEIKTETIARFQKIIGYVQQEVFIKDATLRENIAFGEEIDEISDAKLDYAVRGAMLDSFLEKSSEGYEMMLGENGMKLSGGQKQRIGIARALYKDPDILVLDEITSALDIETEKGIIETIEHLTKLDKTVFIIAHRITTLRSSDRIYELEKGRVSRILKYEELFDEKILKAS